MLALLGTVLASCSSDAPPSRRVTHPLSATAKLTHEPVIVLVAIDGVRWQEVFRGASPELARRDGVSAKSASTLVPNLTRIGSVSGSVLGAPGSEEGFFASGPDFVSLPGYSEMLTGSAQSGCTTNDCPNVSEPTLLDDFVGALGEHDQAAVISSWPRIVSASSLGQRNGVVSTGRHGGFHLERLRGYPGALDAYERALDVRPEPGYDDFRPDRFTAELALAYLEEARPRFLFVSLGETDEHAHKERYGEYLDALHYADSVVGNIQSTLRRFERDGVPTALFVTTDHGRSDHFRDHGAKWPESSRSFLFASGSMIHARGATRGIEASHLADIAPTIRELGGVAPRQAPSGGRVLAELSPQSPARLARAER